MVQKHMVISLLYLNQYQMEYQVVKQLQMLILAQVKILLVLPFTIQTKMLIKQQLLKIISQQVKLNEHFSNRSTDVKIIFLREISQDQENTNQLYPLKIKCSIRLEITQFLLVEFQTVKIRKLKTNLCLVLDSTTQKWLNMEILVLQEVNKVLQQMTQVPCLKVKIPS